MDKKDARDFHAIKNEVKRSNLRILLDVYEISVSIPLDALAVSVFRLLYDIITLPDGVRFVFSSFPLSFSFFFFPFSQSPCLEVSLFSYIHHLQ